MSVTRFFSCAKKFQDEEANPSIEIIRNKFVRPQTRWLLGAIALSGLIAGGTGAAADFCSKSGNETAADVLGIIGLISAGIFLASTAKVMQEACCPCSTQTEVSVPLLNTEGRTTNYNTSRP